MSLRDPLATVRGLGSARHGVQHWWAQRMTAVALMLLTPWFVWLVLNVAGQEICVVRAYIAHPVNATLLLAFVISLLWHARLGLQVVVEDYVHGALELTLQIVIKLAYALAAIAAVIAIGRIAFTA